MCEEDLLGLYQKKISGVLACPVRKLWMKINGD